MKAHTGQRIYRRSELMEMEWRAALQHFFYTTISAWKRLIIDGGKNRNFANAQKKPVNQGPAYFKAAIKKQHSELRRAQKLGQSKRLKQNHQEGLFNRWKESNSWWSRLVGLWLDHQLQLSLLSGKCRSNMYASCKTLNHTSQTWI